MRSFTVVDLSPQCQVRQTAQYEYSLLEKIPGAPELIAGCSSYIWRSPEEFEYPLPQSEGRLILRWRASADTAGIATLRQDQQTLSISLIASGKNADADTITLQAFQQHAVKELHDTAFEPSFDLIGLSQRPLIATVALFMPENEKDKAAFAMIDRCFAAAYFRKLGLV